MTRSAPTREPPGGTPVVGVPPSLRRLAATLAALIVIDAVALVFAYNLAADGFLIPATGLVIVTGLANMIFLWERLYPVRWLAPGIALTVLLVIYPLLFTFYIAFTNYGDGHLLTKQQVIDRFTSQMSSVAEAGSYSWTAYRAPDGGFILWLTDEAGTALLAEPEVGVTPVDAADPRLGPIAEDGLPATIDAATRLSRTDAVRYLGELSRLDIEGDDGRVRILSLDTAALQLPRYTYDEARDVLVDALDGTVYEPVEGTFSAADGRTLSPGFAEVIGPRNFVRAFTDPRIRGPFLGVFAWTVVFALLSVLLTFSLGLALAMVLNDQRLPARGILRTLTIVPYTIPGFISILIWVGLLNPLYGPVNLGLREVLGISPPWFSDGTLAKVAILLINTWLGYAYMLIISLGALQSIPSELYDAAVIDGANRIQQFRKITFPLLLVAVAPLLIGAFAFNFNNFTVIELATRGGPPTPGVATPAGQTDILISYTYRLAFAGGRGTDYGFAAAISVFIFLIIATITAFNFRFTRRLETISENI